MKTPTVWAPQETAELGEKRVHIVGEPTSGYDTLCGHVDRTDYRWREGGKPSCRLCLRIVAYARSLDVKT